MGQSSQSRAIFSARAEVLDTEILFIMECRSLNDWPSGFRLVRQFEKKGRRLQHRS